MGEWLSELRHLPECCPPVAQKGIKVDERRGMVIKDDEGAFRLPNSYFVFFGWVA